jgi:serine/threonine protein kinase
MVRRARDYLPGERLAGTVYEVVRLIGAGGMGTVYDVEDTTIGKRYVLKTLHPQLGAREDLAYRMQREARTLAKLSHPNIVEVITAGVTGDDLRLPFFVMERLNGQSLRIVLEKKGQLDLPHAYHIAIDLLDALDHAHDKGVIHRDVKPDNIFLHRTPGGVTITKLLDFGIQSLLDSTARETAGRFVGTLRYAAPEQLRGEAATPAVDVYAAALVLYEMIAGRGPFDDLGESQAIGAAHLDQPPPPLSRFVPVPRELQRLMSAALAKDPAARPRDAFSFAASLRNLKKVVFGSLTYRQARERGRGVTAAARNNLASQAAGPPPPPAASASPAAAVSTNLPPTVSRARPAARVGDDVPSTGRAAAVAVKAEPPPLLESQAAPLLRPTDAMLQWPHEADNGTSEDPQVQTLSLAAPRPPHSRMRLAAAGVLFSLLAASLFVFSWRRFPPVASVGDRMSVGAAAPQRTVSAPPVSSPPATDPAASAKTETPTAPAAALGETVPAATAAGARAGVALASGSPSAAASSSATTAATALPSASPKRRPAAAAASAKAGVAPSRADRPGPGF